MVAPNKESRLYTMIRQFKTYIITEELIKYNWNVCKTAEAFGVHRNSLTRHIQDLGIIRNESKKTNGKGGARAEAIPVAVMPDVKVSGDGEKPIDKRTETGDGMYVAEESGGIAL